MGSIIKAVAFAINFLEKTADSLFQKGSIQPVHSCKNEKTDEKHHGESAHAKVDVSR